MSNTTYSFQVTVMRRTVNEKGAMTSYVINPELSGVYNAPTSEAACFLAQMRAVIEAGVITTGEGGLTVDDRAAMAALADFEISATRISA